MKETKISVIIPVYRAEETLRRTVGSVLAQTYRNTEIILIDDGSPDSSGVLCDELASDYKNISVIHMDDRGVSAARNAGLRAARGDRVTFLDADDAMEPQMLEVLSQVMEETGAGITGVQFQKVQPAETKADFSEPAVPAGSPEDTFSGSGADPSFPYTIFTGTDIIEEAVLKGDTRIWSKLFDRKVLEGAAFREGLTIGEDMLFFLSLIRENTKYASIDLPLFLYTVNPKGAMERPFTPSYMDQLLCWKLAGKDIQERFPGLHNKAEIRARLASIQALYAVLTAGKIARLPDEDRVQYQPQFQTCVQSLKENLAVSGSYQLLPPDYKIKSVVLRAAPGLYQRIYGSLSRRQ